MKKVIRLTESDLIRLVKRVIKEQATTEPKTSETLKSQNKLMRQKIHDKYKESMSIRQGNLKTMVGDKKDDIASFIKDKKGDIVSLIGRAKDIIDRGADDVEEFAQNALRYSSDVAQDVKRKVQDVKTKVGSNIETAKNKVGSNIETAKIKYFYEQSLELDKEYAKIEQKAEELKRSGTLMTEEEKQKFVNSVSLILISITNILLFIAKKEQTISR